MKLSLKNNICCLAAATALCANAGNIIELNGHNFEIDTLLHVTTGPGIHTTGIRLTSTEKSDLTINTNIFYTTVDLQNPDIELRGVQAMDTECSSENVLQMGLRKNDQNNGQYIAGVNGDFANLNGDFKRTNGLTIIDDKMYNHGIGDESWKKFGSFVAVEGYKEISITNTLEMKRPLKFPSGLTHHLQINTQRNENYLVLYTPEHGESTNTNMWGRECTMKLVSGSIAEGNAVFEITSQWVGDCSGNPEHGNMSIPKAGYVLSGVGTGYNLIGQLQIGDKVSMQPFKFTIDGRDANIHHVIGGCPLIVENGKPISDETCTELNKSTAIQITQTARTAIGYNEDRTTLILAVTDSYSANGFTSGDKSEYGNTSSGLDFPHLANFMIYLGCTTVTAMDGGGSSQLYNKELGICNIPYGNTSYLRPVANGFFVVSNTPVENEIAYIEVKQKNVMLNAGETFTPKVYGYDHNGVLIDTDIKDFTFTVNSKIGTINGTCLTAGTLAGSTHGIVSVGDIKCAVRILTNSGGEFISSGDDADFEIKAPYLTDAPAGINAPVCDSIDDTPEYYNFQGIRIGEPKSGFYIVKRGSATNKEVIMR